MNEIESNDKVSQLAGLVVQSLAILAICVTAILVIDRKAVCSFYEIPDTYSSLDPVSVVPMATVIIIPIIIIWYLIPAISEISVKEEYKTGYRKKNLKVIGTIKKRFKKFLALKAKKRTKSEGRKHTQSRNNQSVKSETNKLKREDSEIIETEKEKNTTGSNIDNVKNQEETSKNKESIGDAAEEDKVKTKDYSVFRLALEDSAYVGYDTEKTSKSTLDIIRMMAYAAIIVMMSYSVLEDMPNSINESEKSLGFSFTIILVCVFSLFMIVRGNLFWAHLREEFSYYLKTVIRKRSDTKKDTKKDDNYFLYKSFGRSDYVRAKIIVFFLIIFWVLVASINLFETVRLSLKYQYGVVELQNEVGNQLYAVILNLDNYCILEPIEEIGDDMVISTESCVYKEKDNIVITQRYYNKVLVNRYSTIAKEQYYNTGSFRSTSQ